MMKPKRIDRMTVILLAVLSIFIGNSLHADQSITLRSGNGTVGLIDSQIRLLTGPENAAFTTALTPANFTSAATGSSASIISPNAIWLATLPSDPSAKWISTGPGGATEGGTALYAIQFSDNRSLIRASAIWERQEFPVRRSSTFFLR